MKKFIILLTLFALASTVSAVTTTVNSGELIQTAITASTNGDIIIVSPGTYVENLNMLGRAITLRSTDPTNAAIVTSTIIDGNAVGSVITCDSGEGSDTVIDGFVITNGSAISGGGMYNTNSSPTVSNCTFSGNSAVSGGGGGVCNSSFSLPVLSNCIFSENTASMGSGMYIFANSSPTLTDSYFCFNPDTSEAIGGNVLHPDSGNNNLLFCPPPRSIVPGDLTGDGKVNMFDLAELAANWLAGT